MKRKKDIMSFFAPKKINNEAHSNTETQEEVQIATEREPEDFSGETDLESEGSEQGEKDEESQSEAVDEIQIECETEDRCAQVLEHQISANAKKSHQCNQT
ncbi:hypothetical protein NQZ68_015583 [Dissostichus eleginoides]|nr:hypothetical protein NQZ68_015583 [Dissostichus eleginoides]